MEDFNKIIESINVRYEQAGRAYVLQPFVLPDYHVLENFLVMVESGEYAVGKEATPLSKGDILFIPAGKEVHVTHGGAAAKSTTVSHEKFSDKTNTYIALSKEGISSYTNELKYLTFEAKVFETVNFFNSLSIPCFIIKSEKITGIMREMVREVDENRVGSQRILKILNEQLVVETIRYIVENKLFSDKLSTNTTYFKDPRLITLFKFIKENLEGDLSNGVLAQITGVSEDYVGQFFKALTGINPQDYIEAQRLGKAVELLRTSRMSIRDIGRECGYKDTAYFCRRFKMMYGVPAGKMRKRETLINV
jgi:AraC family transcriptional regulator, activator of mtrCDE